MMLVDTGNAPRNIGGVHLGPRVETSPRAAYTRGPAGRNSQYGPRGAAYPASYFMRKKLLHHVTCSIIIIVLVVIVPRLPTATQCCRQPAQCTSGWDISKPFVQPIKTRESGARPVLGYSEVYCVAVAPACCLRQAGTELHGWNFFACRMHADCGIPMIDG
jgi:hypothetical protein